MSDGLDFTVGDPDGLPIRLTTSVSAAFHSTTVATKLKREDYPLLLSLWDFRSTPVQHGDIAALRNEIVRLIKAVSSAHIEQDVIDELDELLVFLNGVEVLGLGVHVDGP